MKNTNAFAVAGAMVTAGLAISLGAAFSSCSSENDFYVFICPAISRITH